MSPAADARATAHPLKICRVSECCCLEGGKSQNIFLGERREPGRDRRVPGPVCSDPDGRAHSVWPKPSFPNVHHWHQVAETGVVRGNPRVFGFARNEMSRERGGTLLAGRVWPRFSTQGQWNKRETHGDIWSIAQLDTIGSGLAFSCCSLHAHPSSSLAPALLFLPEGAAGAGSCSWGE